MPSKKLSFHDASVSELTLNLANLKATQTTYAKHISQPTLPRVFSDQKYIIKAGATPKLITSVKESNSLPTLDVPFNNLAIRPSKPSMIAAAIIAIIAISNLLLNANLIELKPMHTPTNVKMFGKITLALFSVTSLKFF